MCSAIMAGVRAMGGWFLVAERRLESGLPDARRLMDADRFGEALPLLRAYASVHLGDAEVAYPLGVCRHAGGNSPAALAARSRVDPRSPWAVRAGLARARTLVGGPGLFREVESILGGLKPGPGSEWDDVGFPQADTGEPVSTT
jgi:enediyne biosynthesis protein E4